MVLFGGVVVHHGGVGAVGGDGVEALHQELVLGAAVLVEDLVHRQLGEGLAGFQPLLQLLLEPDHGHGVPDVALPGVGQLGLVLGALHGQQGIGQGLDGEGCVGFQGAVDRIVDRVGVGQDGLGLAVVCQEGKHLVIACQADAVGFQCLGGLGGQAVPVDEQHSLLLGHKAVGHGVGGAGNVHGTQVQQPCQVVQLAHHLGGAAQPGELGPQPCQLFGGGGACIFRRQQPGRGGGQGGTALGPQLVLQVVGADLHTFGVQHLLEAADQLAGGGEAAQAQHLALGEGVGAVGLHGGNARLAHLHQLDLGAGQLLFGLDKEPAVHPQGAGGQGDHQGGVFAGEPGKIFPAVIMSRQILAGMRIAGGDQVCLAARVLHGVAEGGEPFADGRHHRKLAFFLQGMSGRGGGPAALVCACPPIVASRRTECKPFGPSRKIYKKFRKSPFRPLTGLL